MQVLQTACKVVIHQVAATKFNAVRKGSGVKNAAERSGRLKGDMVGKSFGKLGIVVQKPNLSSRVLTTQLRRVDSFERDVIFYSGLESNKPKT